MAIIGTFTKQENGGYDGTIETITFRAPLTFEPLTKRSEASPEFRIVSGTAEIGAAWERTGKKGRYLSVVLDDPTLAAPVHCRLVKTGVEHNFSLLWERVKPARAA